MCNSRLVTLHQFSLQTDAECVAIMEHLLGYRREYVEKALASHSYDHAAATYWMLRSVPGGINVEVHGVRAFQFQCAVLLGRRVEAENLKIPLCPVPSLSCTL
jgi:hypothetical protein